VVTPGQSLPADVKTYLDRLPETTSTITAATNPTVHSGTGAEATASLTTSDGHEEADRQDDQSGLPVAALAGVVIGSLSVVAIATGLFW
jgi:hypothetical protein